MPRTESSKAARSLNAQDIRSGETLQVWIDFGHDHPLNDHSRAVVGDILTTTVRKFKGLGGRVRIYQGGTCIFE